MNKLTATLCCLLLSLSACSTSQTAAGDPPEYFANLTEKEAEAQLGQVNSDIEELDKEIRGAELRRDTARMRESSDASKGAAADGTDAELESLQTKKGTLIHRQLQLERRLRELNGPAS